MINFISVKKIHFLGVGGVSMSSLARFFFEKGYFVTGSDREYSETLVSLNELGVKTWPGFLPDRIGRPDLCVYSSAIDETDAELNYLRSSGVPAIERFALLPYVSSFFRSVLAIAGTHGKTTGTSMCAWIMIGAGLPLYAHVGGTSVDFGPYHYSGDGYFLTEACEYRRSMLALKPDIAVVLNAEVDHPDTYRDKSDVFDAFDDFLSSSRIRLTNADSEYYALRQKPFSPVTYGFSPSASFRGVNVKQYQNGIFGCQILKDGFPYIDIKMKIPSKTNLENALCACALCSLIGVSKEDIKKGIESFSGVKRRFEYRGKSYSSSVYIDYAHHPTEIRATLKAAENYPHRKIWCVFQPHTYTRTKALLKEFAEALTLADKVVLAKIYPARETDDLGISSGDLAREIRELGHDACYFDSFEKIEKFLKENCIHGDLLITMGAGDVYKIGESLLKE